jgi:membrane-associated protease RseP (regulator of RpoE activity)
MALFFLAVGALVNLCAFFGLRYFVARRCGARGSLVALGLEHRPWTGVPLARKLVFVCAGPVGCYLCAVAFVALGTMVGGKEVVDEDSMRVIVMPGSPAEAAGFHDNDRVVSLNGIPIANWPDLKAEVAGHPGEEIRIAVQRDGREIVLSPTPGPTGKIGITPPVERLRVGVGAAIAGALVEPMRLWALVGHSLKETLVGTGVPTPLSGPAGIVRAAGQPAETTGNAIKFLGVVNSYYLWIPGLLALILFPRSRKGGAPRGLSGSQ